MIHTSGVAIHCRMATYQNVLKELSQQLPAALECAYEAARRQRKAEFIQAVAERLYLLNEAVCKRRPSLAANAADAADPSLSPASPWEEVARRVQWQQAVSAELSRNLVRP